VALATFHRPPLSFKKDSLCYLRILEVDVALFFAACGDGREVGVFGCELVEVDVACVVRFPASMRRGGGRCDHVCAEEWCCWVELGGGDVGKPRCAMSREGRHGVHGPFPRLQTQDLYIRKWAFPGQTFNKLV
jgi:hypothetical protein